MEKLKQLSTKLKSSPKMPVLFVGHGNPMNAIYDNEFTRSWEKIGKTLPEAQAIVVISAHWLTNGTKITDAPKQKIIYDFYGFPDELYNVKYDANGDKNIAEELRQALIDYEAKLDSTWGLDHGTWSVLKHLSPKPKVPVLQISLDMNQSLEKLVKMFKELKPLREKGVIFIGSGNIVHNLRMVDFSNTVKYSWAEEFDKKSADAMSNHNLELLENPRNISTGWGFAVPTDDHYRPMLAAMSLLNKTENLHYFNEKIDLGTVGMRSFIAG